MNTAPVIDVRGVSHEYERWGHKVRALDGVSLAIEPGQWVMLTGHNGSGKSTLLRLLAGRMPVQVGQVRVAGLDVAVASRRALAHAVFLVQQDPTAGTSPRLTVGEHLLLARPGSGPRRAFEAGARAQLEAFELEVGLNQPADTLSGGQRQLLVLLMASLRPAPVILLDEPLAALDPARAASCMAALRLVHQAGKTLVQVTHDAALAARAGDRVVKLGGGRIAADSAGSGTGVPTVSGDVRPVTADPYLPG